MTRDSHIQFVDAADIADATQSSSPTVELVARREYWKQLNDPYRELYRTHRKDEDKAAQEYEMPTDTRRMLIPDQC